MHQHAYRLPDEASRVPRDAGGIYQFCLRFPTDYELGLRLPGADVSAARGHVLKFLTEVSPLFGVLGIKGLIHTLPRARHLQMRFVLNASRLDTKDSARRFEHHLGAAMSEISSAKATTSALKMAFAVAPPAYVGIASRQSLGARLEQHLAGQTGMAQRIAKLGLSWRYFEFRCTPLAQQQLTLLPDLEQLLQALFKPQLSDR
jgi:hypothetical protein